jgi:hypothetical protein
MKRNLVFEIYAYVMLAVFTCLAVVHLADVPKDCLGVIRPRFALSEKQALEYGNNDAYKMFVKDTVKLETEEQVTEHRLAAYQNAIAASNHGAFQELIQDLTRGLASALVAFVHWKLARRSRQSSHEGETS